MTRYAKEISLTVVIKLMLLTAIWFFCFSHPVADRMTRQDLAHHLLPTTTQEPQYAR